jgi:hypothetical protein
MEAWPAAQPNNQTTISRLLVSGAVPDLGAARSRVERLLSASDLHPPGLAPSAIVCIRKLRDPLPGLLALDQRSLHPPHAWQQAVNDAIERLIRRAARPIREAVPANAECVVFADRAEMLACLAVDWGEGRVGIRWWWRSLLPGLDGSRSILACWLEAPEYIPGAWLHLSNSGKAAEFAGRMSADEARDMLRAVAIRFELDDLQAVVDARPSGPAKGVDARDSFRTLQSKAEPPSAPWESWAPESDRITLGIEQRCLLGIALTLQRAPTVVRTRSFAHAAHRWFKAAKNDLRSEQAAPVTSRKAFNRIPVAASATEYESSRSKQMAESRRIGVSFQDAKADEGGAHRDIESPRDRAAPPDVEEQPRDSETFESDFSMNELEGVSVASRRPVSDDRDGGPEDELDVERFPQPSLTRKPRSETPIEYRETAPLLEAQINTNFGGLFYLLNFGLYLELYGDMTTPSARDIPLGVWDFLALAGERLVGSELRDDPLWALLTRLAGRDETREPGDDCVMPEYWRMPAQWMEPFEPDSVWRWEANEDRLRVWHPAGFIALDLPLEPGDRARQLRREMEAFARFSPKIGRSRKRPGGACLSEESQDSLQLWLDWLTPYARARLRLALGLTESDDVGRALCECRARVFVTATHMDVMFSLAELLVEIRLAGLDRDPGWIMDTGRIIRFHFE